MAKVEIFTADCYLCDDVVQQVNDLACSKCEVVVYDLNKTTVTSESEDKAKAYGIQFVPAVAINGKLIDLELLKRKDARLT
ncbi:glutaredoxin [Paenibacillus sp. WST5]|uniref:Glutaredoxin n=2 Tax=Paenibacillus sedimenti TaxID=2770274 RepID=A0A926QL27_9BACL|nr:glutaredoxin [Paenibacillus sedimenti]